IALADDARAFAPAAAAPHDHRLSQVVDRDRGVTLIADSGRVDLKFVADGLARGGVLPREDAPAAGVLPVARPGNQIIPVCVRRDTGVLLVAGGRRVDEFLVSQSVAGCVEALGIDPPAAALLVVASPRDDEVARAVEGHRGPLLVACGGAVDEEPVTQGVAVGVEATSIDIPAVAVLEVAGPGDDERPAVVHAHARELLIAGGGAVDEELAAQCVPTGAEPLTVHVPVPSRAVAAGPDDDKVAVAVDPEHGVRLVACGGAVDEELVTQGIAVGVEATSVDIPAVAVLSVARPGDDEAAISGHGHHRGGLIAGGGGVDEEFITEEMAGGVQA